MQLAFRVGDRVKVTARDYEGKTGKIIDIHPADPSLPYKVRLDNGVITFKGEKTIAKIKRGRKPKEKKEEPVVEEKHTEEQVEMTCPLVDHVNGQVRVYDNEPKEEREEEKEMMENKNERTVSVAEPEPERARIFSKPEVRAFDPEEFVTSKRMSYCVGKAVITLCKKNITKEDIRTAIELLVKEHKVLDGE